MKLMSGLRLYRSIRQLALFVLVALALLALWSFAAATAAADHDMTTVEREATLADCLPTWDLTQALELRPDATLSAWTGQTLHGESVEARDIFWRTWGLPFLETPTEPTYAEIYGGVHVQRWAWEENCLHPPTPTPKRPVRASAALQRNYEHCHEYPAGVTPIPYRPSGEITDSELTGPAPDGHIHVTSLGTGQRRTCHE